MHCHLLSLERVLEEYSSTPTSSSTDLNFDDRDKDRSHVWRKVEVIDIQQPHDVRVHFEGLSCEVRIVVRFPFRDSNFSNLIVGSYRVILGVEVGLG